MAFSPDGHFLATCSKDRTARVWDLATGKCCATLTGHAQEINSISYVGEGQTLATASEDGTVRLWDAKTAKQRDILWKHPVEVVGLAYDATRGASGGGHTRWRAESLGLSHVAGSGRIADPWR